MFHTKPSPGSPGDHLRHKKSRSWFVADGEVIQVVLFHFKKSRKALASIHSLRTKHQYKWGPLDVSWLITRMKTIVISTYKYHKP